MKRRDLFAFAGGAAASLALPGAASAQQLQFFRIGTGGTAGTYFPIGGLIANAISSPPGSRACADGGLDLQCAGGTGTGLAGGEEKERAEREQKDQRAHDDLRVEGRPAGEGAHSRLQAVEYQPRAVPPSVR